jgi:hypothetical protein
MVKRGIAKEVPEAGRNQESGIGKQEAGSRMGLAAISLAQCG